MSKKGSATMHMSKAQPNVATSPSVTWNHLGVSVIEDPFWGPYNRDPFGRIHGDTDFESNQVCNGLASMQAR